MKTDGPFADDRWVYKSNGNTKRNADDNQSHTICLNKYETFVCLHFIGESSREMDINISKLVVIIMQKQLCDFWMIDDVFRDENDSCRSVITKLSRWVFPSFFHVRTCPTVHQSYFTSSRQQTRGWVARGGDANTTGSTFQK